MSLCVCAHSFPTILPAARCAALGMQRALCARARLHLCMQCGASSPQPPAAQFAGPDRMRACDRSHAGRGADRMPIGARPPARRTIGVRPHDRAVCKRSTNDIRTDDAVTRPVLLHMARWRRHDVPAPRVERRVNTRCQQVRPTFGARLIYMYTAQQLRPARLHSRAQYTHYEF